MSKIETIATEGQFRLCRGKFGTFFIHVGFDDEITELTNEDVLKRLATGHRAEQSLKRSVPVNNIMQEEFAYWQSKLNNKRRGGE